MTTFLAGSEPGRAAGVAVGRLVFADASALDAGTGRRVAEARTVADETRICLQRLEATLRRGGCSLADLVKLNAYLADDADRAEFRVACDEVLAARASLARIIQVAPLESDTRVLLDAVAARPA